MQTSKTTSINVAILEDNNDYVQIINAQIMHSAIAKVSRYRSITDLLDEKLASINILIIDADNYETKDNSADFKQQLLRLKEIAPHLKIIVISSNIEPQTLIGLFKIGIIDYIVKEDNTLDLLGISVKEIIDYFKLNVKFSTAKTSREAIIKRLLIHGVVLSIIVLAILIKNIIN